MIDRANAAFDPASAEVVDTGIRPQVLHTPYEKLDLAIVPGPPQLVEPAVSFETHEILQYPPHRVADAILAAPNTTLKSSNDPTWWDWSAMHHAADGTIKIDFTLFDTEPVSWGGSSLVFDCGPQSLLDFWLAIRLACPAAWLHDASCRLYSPESFSELYLDSA